MCASTTTTPESRHREPDPLMPASVRDTAPASSAPEGEALLARVRKSLIGHRAALQTPFGERPLIYADYTASGRALDFLEDNIREQVLPYYANTHTEASFTGAQTNALREAARQAIRNSVNGGADDKIIFCGAGATAAIDRIIAILGIRLPAALTERYKLMERIPAKARPVVFLGPYEHHSNELPWRESIADVVRIGLDDTGNIDQEKLAEALTQYAERPLRIGSFSAASNVTGVRSDVPGITRLLKRSGALAFWDYAAAGPYVKIDMNLRDAAIDAIFLSPHKFIGGPGTPGVLVAKAALLKNKVPAVVGGGTVSYVSPTEHHYLENPEHREEGGTPGIIESIRAGAVFALKDRLGDTRIEDIEQQLVRQALDALADMPQVEVLGPDSPHRLGIFSLRIRHAGRDLHYGYLAALLNDLFGIQARGGCSCAGPYGHELLGINVHESHAIERVVAQGFECFKPGWIRVNLHYAAAAEEIDYLLNALRLVAKDGWRLLPSYRLNAQSGLWVHRDARRALPVRFENLLTPNLQNSAPLHACKRPLDQLLDDAEQVLVAGAPAAHRSAAQQEQPLPDELASKCWFILPGTAANRLQMTAD